MSVMRSIAADPRIVTGGAVLPSRIWAPLLAAGAVAAAIEIGGAGLEIEARRALQIFALAIVGWTLTKLDDAFVALTAGVAMALATDEADDLFEALGDELIWLMLASFMLAAALRATGLAGRLAALATSRAGSVRGVFHGLTAAMIATAFLIPSTSGRAALMVPVFLSVAAGASLRIRKALALLFPTVILLSAIASLTGAGAHMLAADLVDRLGDHEIGFLRWAALGLPFAAVSCFASAEAILRLFLSSAERRSPLVVAPVVEDGDRAARMRVLAVVGLVLAGWASKPLHGLDDTLVALLGALAVTVPQLGGIGFKDALKGVEWSLILFMAATIMIAEGLTESGVAEVAADAALGALQGTGLPPLAVLTAIAAAGLLSHLVVHSRTARVAILLPPVLVAARGAGLDPAMAAFVTVAATGFCQLLMVSAKPVALFGGVEGGSYGPRDLLRLGAALAPLHLVLLVLFAGLVWPLLGLGLVAR